ncbi:hypothetical protein AGLY_001904 [Aphis glycines]|uniref:AAA-ATPase-like domain-containing protein n=1 Tax=Aphis glycines TaxID=307491 RepID=A0A6G0U6S4_APHGL|nr:hypothetical protein AGLY_001904 [Aphis glycines]
MPLFNPPHMNKPNFGKIYQQGYWPTTAALSSLKLLTIFISILSLHSVLDPITSSIVAIEIFQIISLIAKISSYIEIVFYLNSKLTILKIRCSYCYDCNASIQNILNNVEIISNEENASFNFSSSDFIKILQTTGFIDKTLMIRKVDTLGNPISKADSETPITDTSNYELFRNLKISRETNIMNQHFGKYPVLYAKFKTKDEISCYSEAIDEAKEIIHKSFELHSYLKKSTKLSNKQRAVSKFWCDGTRYKMAVFDDVIIGLRSLCKFLSKHFNKPCYVLIDDLDSFIVTDTDTTADTLVEEYRCIFSFLKQFLLFLNNKKYVFQAFMTGKSSLAIHGILPVCIEMKQFYSCHEFTDYFGLTNDELEYLFRKPEFINIQITAKEVKAYYGAYNKFAVNENRKNQIYCIWSILNVLKRKRFDNYWRDFGTFFRNFSNKHIKAIMQDLVMTEKDLDITLFNKPKLIALPIPPLIFKTTEDIYSNKSLEYFCYNMLDLGYLTCNKAPLVIQVSTTDETNFTANLIIPNEEYLLTSGITEDRQTTRCGEPIILIKQTIVRPLMSAILPSECNK